MIKKAVAFIAIVVTVCSVSSNVVSAQSVNSKSTSINTYVEKALRQYDIPGASLKIEMNGQTVAQKSLGVTSDDEQVTADTPFLIGSLSKTFTALSILQLKQGNKVKLTEPIDTYLPAFQYNSPNDRKITVQQLLDQTSGIGALSGLEVTDRNYSEKNGLQEAVQALSGVQLQDIPGKSYAYTSANYLLLGAIIEKTSGQSYANYIEEKIFKPLAMTRSSATYVDSRQDGLSAGNHSWLGYPIKGNGFYDNSGASYGYISSTVNDLSRFLHFVQKGNEKVLTADQLKFFMQEPPANKTYKLGWHYSHEDRLFYHGGATPEFRAEMFYDSERQLSGVILTNKYHSLEDRQVSDIVSGIRDISNGKEPQTLRQQNHLEQWVVINLIAVSLVAMSVRVWRLVKNSTSSKPWRYVAAALLLLLATLMSLGTPYLFGAPWHSIMLFAPDIAYGVMLLILSLILNALLLLYSRKK